jgi:FlaA1/EpsC-like NDP-sugar epimerase
MGATKRMAEQVACSFSSQEGLNVAAVRFGNVLDSEGSVLPLFREQIQRGGPITITHPDVTRYFMTIPEASSLVLEASRLSRGRDVFLLDMGEPFRIVELAEELVRLCGLRPYEDIEFKWTGLRKGEKLFEELFIDFAQSEKTQHPKILSSKTDLKGSLPEDWRSRLESFGSKEEIPDENELISWITHWVPEYTGRAISVHENASTATQENVSRYVH